MCIAHVTTPVRVRIRGRFHNVPAAHPRLTHATGGIARADEGISACGADGAVVAQNVSIPPMADAICTAGAGAIPCNYFAGSLRFFIVAAISGSARMESM